MCVCVCVCVCVCLYVWSYKFSRWVGSLKHVWCWCPFSLSPVWTRVYIDIHSIKCLWNIATFETSFNSERTVLRWDIWIHVAVRGFIPSRPHWGSAVVIFRLTHLGWDKMDAVLQTKFSSKISWEKMFVFLFKFHQSLLPRCQLAISQYCFRQWLDAEQATCHCMKQWWYEISWSQCVKRRERKWLTPAMDPTVLLTWACFQRYILLTQVKLPTTLFAQRTWFMHSSVRRTGTASL